VKKNLLTQLENLRNVEQQDDYLKMLKIDQKAKKIENSILKAVSAEKMSNLQNIDKSSTFSSIIV
jgi:hypothetical protein